MIIFTWGRFNPPTIGHEKIVNTVMKLANESNCDYLIYTTPTHNMKNPLSPKDKLHFLQSAFGNKIVIVNTFIEALIDIKSVHDTAILIVGNDRVSEFKRITKKYMEDNPELDILVFSGGKRSNKNYLEGISSTKVKKMVKECDKASFMKSMPLKMKNSDKIALWITLSKTINIGNQIRISNGKHSKNSQ